MRSRSGSTGRDSARPVLPVGSAPMPPRWRTLAFGPLELTLVLVAGAGAVVGSRALDQGAAARTVEQVARDRVRAVWEAERRFRADKRLDADGDGTSEYGGLSDLHRAGLLGGPVRSDGDAEYLEVPGYRIEVLRAHRVDKAGRALFVRGPTGVDPALSAQIVAVVAVPRVDRVPGHRGFYKDALGREWEAEGVLEPDVDVTFPPPGFELRADVESEQLDGPIWRRPLGEPGVTGRK